MNGRVGRALVTVGLIVGIAGCSLVNREPAAVQPAPPATPVKTDAPVFPLQVDSTRRYLVDQRNQPFLIVGDSPQSMVVNLSEQQAAQFLANRRRAGFNSVWVNLLCDKYTGGRDDGSTYDGIHPFQTAGDLSTPNEAYFERVDAIVRLARNPEERARLGIAGCTRVREHFRSEHGIRVIAQLLRDHMAAPGR